MGKIKKIQVLEDSKILFVFDDSSSKTIDFHGFIGKSRLTEPLLGKKYFNQVAVYENGRGIYWPNGFDFCADFLKEIEPNLINQ